MNSCRVTFKTTPVNIGIPFKMISYPKPYDVLQKPPVIVPDELSNRLVTGNLRAESSMTKEAENINCTFI